MRIDTELVVEYRVFTRVDVSTFSYTSMPEPEGFWVEELPLPGQPEIEQVLGKIGADEPTVIFTPHLIPMQRGILTTCYIPLAGTGTDIAELYEEAYSKTPFVAVTEKSPNTRWVTNSNRVLVKPHLDPRTNTAVVLVAIDNLTKGTAGAAIQSVNIALGLDETAGLPLAGWMP